MAEQENFGSAAYEYMRSAKRKRGFACLPELARHVKADLQVLKTLEQEIRQKILEVEIQKISGQIKKEICEGLLNEIVEDRKKFADHSVKKVSKIAAELATELYELQCKMAKFTETGHRELGETLKEYENANKFFFEELKKQENREKELIEKTSEDCAKHLDTLKNNLKCLVEVTFEEIFGNIYAVWSPGEKS